MPTAKEHAEGATVYMKRYPGIMWIVIKVGTSPSGARVYTVRAPDAFDDTRGSLVWADDLQD
jgi:hypothetical protein